MIFLVILFALLGVLCAVNAFAMNHAGKHRGIALFAIIMAAFWFALASVAFGVMK